MTVQWIILLVVVLTLVVPGSSLICFECVCRLGSCQCNEPTETWNSSHCIITRTDALTYVIHSSTSLEIDHPSHLLITESIVYSKESNGWFTRSYEVTFACDWDYCNHPQLIVHLQTTSKVTLNQAWFTANIYGTGSGLQCHHCRESICTNATHSTDFQQCSIQSCNRTKICALHSAIGNVNNHEQCVRSACLSEEPTDEKYRVLVKLLVYLMPDQADFRIWGLDVRCGARNCSRPTIFREMQEQLAIQIDNRTLLLATRPENTTTAIPDGLECFDSSPMDQQRANNRHCMILSHGSMTSFGHIPSNSTQFHIREFPYILIRQSISFNASQHEWITATDFISYGCDQHFCNEFQLVSSLADALHISVNKSWLNTNVLNGNVTERDCNQCANHSICTIDGSFDRDRCPVQRCHGTCSLSNVYHHNFGEQQCYRSYCAPLANDSSMIVEGILYLHRSPPAVELWEVQIPCLAANCSRAEIFHEVRNHLVVRIGDLSAFVNTEPNTTTAMTTVAPSIYDRHTCNSSLLVPSLNGSCVAIADANNEAVDYLRDENNAGNSTAVAHALTVYFGATAAMDSSEQEELDKTLTPDLIDTLVGVLNTTITRNSSASFIICRPTNEQDQVLGVFFHSGIGGQIIDDASQSSFVESNFTAAAVISPEVITDTGITYLNMLIIDTPPIEYHRLNNSAQSTLSSSVIVVKTQHRAAKRRCGRMNITLYFTALVEIEHETTNGAYSCSFYDDTTSSWNESGCTTPIFDSTFQRYECSCNHLTSFALIWRPTTVGTHVNRSFSAEDITSLVFQLISILCFLVILLHSLIRRCRRRHQPMHLEARELLPLISCASTALLFLFYIVLSLVVYTQTQSLQQDRCFQAASVLMFFVYFHLIFMFCAKTSVGYFNYLRFTHPLSPPSLKRLRTLLLASSIISVGCLAFAIGFHSSESFVITRLYPYRLCWFTTTAVHYFMTIPIIIFLLLNVVMIILVARCLIQHARNLIGMHQMDSRVKMCVIVLLSSCTTQGVGWLMGPVLSAVGTGQVRVFAWFFIVFNALEGLWSIVLYIVIIRMQSTDDRTPSVKSELLAKLSSPSSDLQKRQL